LAIEILESREVLRGFSVADWPNMDAKGRARSHKDFSNLAYPKHLRPRKIYSNEELGKLIRGASK